MQELTELEREAFEKLWRECHDELAQGIPPINAVKQCNRCRKLIAQTCTCPLYPEWIPDKVLRGEDCPEFEAKA